ncbi:hypothetical protein SASPL_147471 [Salvia splendens]|uniref:Leucine-rich repeat-containing N-terminal plant-type domain-containing protein n=1 Tax=Salvia splendens TaxID=180675 RepID=A0A8X8WEI7_SALSN|nr:polygalacturonase inhibitor 1-like [Salvia splendens]KAG6393235.1 hypothetical protein SASPL_147471 [Salvia splendens]
MLPLLLTITFILFHLHISAAARLCRWDDRAALTAFKNSFTNPNPFPTWDPAFDCCDWYGVKCNDTTSRVISLDIASHGSLTGPIPSSLANLTYLQNLCLHKIPNLVGQTPPSLTKIPNLRFRVISWTNISGPIPHFLAQIKNLAYLDLSFNRLSGTLPPSLPTLPYLFAIDLSRNQLTGPIPEAFGHFQKAAGFQALDLSHNKLFGPLPSSLTNVPFSSVDVCRNNLTGDTSVFFGKGKAASRIDISRNGFEFDLSKESFMESLDMLDISHNRIYGEIPKQITEAVYFQFLNVSYNRL